MAQQEESFEVKAQRMSPAENAAVGVAAGIIEVTALQPILYWKNAAQQNLPFTLNPRYLYRGLLMSVTNMAILTGMQFPLAGICANIFTGGEAREMSGVETIGAAFTGGAISGFACGPMELVMIQQQRFGGSLLATPARLISSFGFLSLGRGTVMSCGREGLYTAGILGMVSVFQKNIEQAGVAQGTFAKILGSIGAGVVAAVGSHPLDTVKSCIQGDLEHKVYKSQFQTAALLYQQGGIPRFYTGVAFRTTRMILAVAIMNECKIRLSPLMFPKHFQ